MTGERQTEERDEMPVIGRDFPVCHAVVVGEQPHEGCDVCDLLAVLERITEVDEEGTPVHNQVAMYQLAADALASSEERACDAR